MKKYKKITLLTLLTASYLQGASLITDVTNGIFASEPVPYKKGDKFFAKNGKHPPVLLSVLEKKEGMDLINVLPDNKIKHVGKKGDKLKIIDTNKYPVRTFKAPSPVTGRGLLDKNITENKIIHSTKTIEPNKEKITPKLILPPVTEKYNFPQTAEAYKEEQNPHFEPLNTNIKPVPEYYSPTPNVEKQTNKILGFKPEINIIIVKSSPGDFTKNQKIILNSKSGIANEFEVIKITPEFSMLKGENQIQKSDYKLHTSINNYLK